MRADLCAKAKLAEKDAEMSLASQDGYKRMTVKEVSHDDSP
jgi:hypothetical protein